MSVEVDQKVVEMRFDNKQFEAGVQTTMSTLEKFKQKLSFKGATKGLEEVSDAAKRCNLSGLNGAIESVRSGFSAMEVMGVTALANITNSAVNAGKRMVKAFTIDPVKTGFKEYETQINAVQTILANTASKGTTLKQVNNALDELNAYADKTIYNFTEMTRNIGTFTAAGVDLDKSVSAIQGIANLAAVSGSTSQQASTAMYQLSQAISSGTVRLMDWNSVVNAGMGGEVFQNALKETARLHGVAIDQIIKDQGSFRESLSQGWLSADILTETLKKFTTSGVNEYLAEYTGLSIESINQMRNQALASGDTSAAYKEMAKTLAKSCELTEDQVYELLNMSTTAEDAATKVKTFTQLMDTLKEAAQSGWTQTWEIIVGDFEEAKQLLTDVSNTFGAMIGASADARNSMLQGWKDLGGRTALIEAARNAFEGMLSVIKPIKEAFRDIFPRTTADQLFKITNSVKEFSSHLKLSDETSANLKSTVKGLFAVLDILKQALTAVSKLISPLVGGLTDLGGGVLGVTASFGDWLVSIDEAIKKSGIFNTFMQGVVIVVQGVINAVKKLASLIKEKIVSPGFESFHSLLERIHERMSNIIHSASDMGSSVSSAFETMGKSLSDSKFIQMMEGVWNAIKTIGKGITSALSSFVDKTIESVNSVNFDNLFDLINGGILASIGLALRKFISNLSKIGKDGKGFIGGIKDIKDAILDTFGAFQSQLQAKALIEIAKAIAILAASILVISLIDSKKLATSLAGIGALFAELMGAMMLFGKLGGSVKLVGKSVTTMVAISTSILILAAALKKISDLDVAQLIVGVVGIGALTKILVSSMKAIGANGKLVVKGATQMVIFAAALKILASVCSDLAQLNLGQLVKGLVGVGALMAGVSLFLNKTEFNSKSISTATGILVLSGAIKVLASACSDFGQLNVEQLIKGLGSIGALLLGLSLFVNKTKSPEGIMTTGFALIEIGAATKIFASSIKDLSALSWGDLVKGLFGIGVALAAVTVALKFMPKDIVGTGIGLIAVSGALVIMSDALSRFGEMSLGEIAKGLLALGGSLAIISVGLIAMSGTLSGSAALLVAAGALAILAPALSMISAIGIGGVISGLIALAGAFTVIGVAGALLTPLIPTILGLSGAFALIGVAVLGIGAGLLAAGTGLSAIAVGITALATAGAAGATAIVSSLAVIITGVVSLIPTIATKIAEGIVTFCGAIGNGIPKIMEAVKKVLLSVIDTIVTITPKVVDALVTLLNMLLQKLEENVPVMIQAGFNILIGLLTGIRDNIGQVVTVVIEIVETFVNAVAAQIPKVAQSAVNLIVSFIDALGETIREQTPRLVDAAIGLAKNIVQGLIDGLLGGIKSIGNAVKELGSTAINGLKDILDINSPSKVFASLGRFTSEGFAKGILSGQRGVEKSSNSLAEAAIKTTKSVISSLVDRINNDINTQPTIRPVLDLTNVESGTRKLSNMLSRNQAMSISAGMNRTSSEEIQNRDIPVGNNGPINQFIQNNYSPKALSRVDIYRQTKNLISTSERVVGA